MMTMLLRVCSLITSKHLLFTSVATPPSGSSIRYKSLGGNINHRTHSMSCRWPWEIIISLDDEVLVSNFNGNSSQNGLYPREEMAADPELIPAAVEELLRYEAP